MKQNFGKSIKNGNYSWLNIPKGKKKKLFRLIDIYSKFTNMVDNVKELNKKVEEVKKLKDLPDDDDSSPMDEE